MTMIDTFLKEMEAEAQTTRKMLALVPDDKFGWKPHEKSMAIERLATHIAELPTWVTMTVNTNELDFNSNAYVPKIVKNNKELMQFFEESLADGIATLKKTKDDILSDQWVLRNGDTIISKRTKAEVFRMAYSQIIHHRAQMGVFLRLLNVPIPGSYGPSADDMAF
ncbi:MAG: hypothetical protein JWP12_3650 [Bacteroidetes bacterium]|nr:hypothetical protein [Bacteroidota bacterium]